MCMHVYTCEFVCVCACVHVFSTCNGSIILECILCLSIPYMWLIIDVRMYYNPNIITYTICKILHDMYNIITMIITGSESCRQQWTIRPLCQRVPSRRRPGKTM